MIKNVFIFWIHSEDWGVWKEKERDIKVDSEGPALCAHKATEAWELTAFLQLLSTKGSLDSQQML